MANIIPVVFNFCTGALPSLHLRNSSVRLARGSLSSAVVKPFCNLSFFSFSPFYLLATIYSSASSAIVFILDENPLKIFPQSCYFSSFHYLKLKVVKIMYLASDLQWKKKREIGKKRHGELLWSSQGQFVLGHQGQRKRANSWSLLNCGTNQGTQRSLQTSDQEQLRAASL